MAKVTVKVQVKKSIWLTPCLRMIAALLKCNLITLDAARCCTSKVTNRAIKYRVNGGSWKRFESPIILGGAV